MDIKKIALSAITIILLVFSSQLSMAYKTQSAAIPGEVLDSDGDATTAVLMSGTFAYEVTSTGIGTILIQRSENNSTWVTVKTLTNTSAGDRRKYLYEAFGENGQPNDKAWYKAVMSGDPSSGSFRVRFVK